MTSSGVLLCWILLASVFAASGCSDVLTYRIEQAESALRRSDASITTTATPDASTGRSSQSRLGGHQAGPGGAGCSARRSNASMSTPRSSAASVDTHNTNGAAAKRTSSGHGAGGGSCAAPGFRSSP